uniref:Secreted protein n=1 Tax=Panagrellus redivivus TaxID=6233 RepID=A0A7E4VNC1_PANRE
MEFCLFLSLLFVIMPAAIGNVIRSKRDILHARHDPLRAFPLSVRRAVIKFHHLSTRHPIEGYTATVRPASTTESNGSMMKMMEKASTTMAPTPDSSIPYNIASLNRENFPTPPKKLTVNLKSTTSIIDLDRPLEVLI